MKKYITNKIRISEKDFAPGMIIKTSPKDINIAPQSQKLHDTLLNMIMNKDRMTRYPIYHYPMRAQKKTGKK